LIPKPQKKPKLKKKKINWLKEADEYFSKYIKAKHQENGFCQCASCGNIIEYGSRNCQAGHFVSRRFWEFRFDEDNVFPQCFRCNITFKGCFEGYSPFIIKTVGKKKHDYMVKVSNDILRGLTQQKRFSDEKFKEIAIKYKEKLKGLE
jgi:hypothetical protein